MSTRQFDGLLFIGDPHVCSKKVGRRKDDYLQSVLEKLAYCAQLCQDYNLMPLISGDLFHRSYDNSLKMLTRLTRVLKTFPTAPLVLDGNHDMALMELSDDDALALLSEAGTVRTVDKAGEIEQVLIAGELVRLWGCPFGAEIPTSLPKFDGTTIMLTHHDMAFKDCYPQSKPLLSIENCESVWNGHIHGNKPSELVGTTWWHNPGNIEPLSVDLADHIPRAWLWTPDTAPGELTGLDLPHGTDLFDLTGRLVDAADSDEAVKAWADAAGEGLPLGLSQFSALIKAQTQSDATKTDDASVLAMDLNEVLQVATVSAASRQLMQGLFDSLTKSVQTTE